MKIVLIAMGTLSLVAAGASAQTIGCVKPGVYVVKQAVNARAQFNRMQVDSIFNGVALTNETRDKAEIVVDEAKARSPGVALRDDHMHVATMKLRNEKLLALVSSPADRQRVEQNLAAMEVSPHRCDVNGP